MFYQFLAGEVSIMVLSISSDFLDFFFLGILDLVLNFPGYHRWKFTDVLRNLLKIIVSLAWTVILPLFYVHSFKGAPDQIKDMLSFLKQINGVPPLYILAVAVYLLPNLLAAALFVFPMLRRWIENSDWHIIRFLLWWSQVLYSLCFCPLTIFVFHVFFQFFELVESQVTCLSYIELNKNNCTRPEVHIWWKYPRFKFYFK